MVVGEPQHAEPLHALDELVDVALDPLVLGVARAQRGGHRLDAAAPVAERAVRVSTACSVKAVREGSARGWPAGRSGRKPSTAWARTA